MPSPSRPTAAGEPFEIVEEDVSGVRLRTFANTPRSLRAVWDLTAAYGDVPYLVYDGERYGFDRTRSMVASLARRLVDDLGVRKGDRVAIAMRNYPEWAVSFWAATLAGAVVVPLNAWWTGTELAYALDHCGAGVLVADGERLDRLGPHRRSLGIRAVVARGDPDGGPSADLALADLLTGEAELPDVDLAPDDDATIMYTSGTTGRPKGAVGTHRNICAHVMNGRWAASARHAGPAASRRGARPATLLTFPLFHVGGLHAFLIPYAALGGKVVLLYRWDAARALDLIEREQVTGVGGVPTTMLQLLDEARRQGRTLPTVGGMASGAAPVPPALVRRIDRQLESRAAPSNAYGLTETQGVVAVNAGAEYLERPGSVGRPISPVVEVRIASVDGEPLPPDEVGEIWVRGPTVVRGYFRDPAATAAAITDGWFHTGDLGRLDADGYLYVVDRAKDVIIRGGENVYAAEVEAALYEHPSVAEAAVVGVPDERLGEQVVGVVRPRAGVAVDEAELRGHVGARLAAFKVPARVWIVGDELPRNAAGKVLKRELRDRLAAGRAT